MPEITVSFVCATYNRGPILLDCLRQTLAAAGLPKNQFEIIVVDNASTDGTADRLATELPAVKLIRLHRNEGPVAKNHGIRQARGAFVFVLDDDAYPLPGTIPQMLRHFAADERLGAAVCAVILPDGRHEACAYPDVFIGAGTGLRRRVLDRVGLFPTEFFMQAEEYDLSFRIINAGFAVRRFDDLPLHHLKTPQARAPATSTARDVRNNLYLLARYLPAPLCYQLSTDWLNRYFRLALAHDQRQGGVNYRQAFLRGAACGLKSWSMQRRRHRRLNSAAIEQIFKFDQTAERLAAACRQVGARRILFADWGKNMLAYYRAAQATGVSVVGIADDQLAAAGVFYRGLPVLSQVNAETLKYDAIVVSNLNPVQAPRRAAALARVSSVPVFDLFADSDLRPNAHRRPLSLSRR